MAIITAKFSKSKARMKAAVRYIEHRAGRDGEKVTRELFGIDGVMDRQQAYQMIDDAEKGTAYFRLVISPDPAKEDTEKDLHLAELTRQTMLTLEERLRKEVPYVAAEQRLQEITAQTMLKLEERIQKPVSYVAAEHDDHAPHRHVHVVALVRGRLNTQDFQAMRQTATQTALSQRQERDQAREQQQQQQPSQTRQQKGAQWGL